jgi:hypothetical protein
MDSADALRESVRQRLQRSTQGEPGLFRSGSATLDGDDLIRVPRSKESREALNTSMVGDPGKPEETSRSRKLVENLMEPISSMPTEASLLKQSLGHRWQSNVSPIAGDAADMDDNLISIGTLKVFLLCV